MGAAIGRRDDKLVGRVDCIPFWRAGVNVWSATCVVRIAVAFIVRHACGPGKCAEFYREEIFPRPDQTMSPGEGIITFNLFLPWYVEVALLSLPLSLSFSFTLYSSLPILVHVSLSPLFLLIPALLPLSIFPLKLVGRRGKGMMILNYVLPFRI